MTYSFRFRGWQRASNVLIAAVFIFVAGIMVTGCMPRASGSPDVDPINPLPAKSTVDLVLYFADDQATEILPEFRRVEVPSDPSQRIPHEKLAVQELLKGPSDALLKRTLPPEARLLSLEVTDGVAFVNFSKEMQTKHWGGSTGEGMTLASLVNTLTEFQGIQKVQILIDGKTVETLVGHFETSLPLARAIRPGDVFTSQERAQALQKRLDGGEDSWRGDPLEVARKEAPARGFLTSMTYAKKSEAEGSAVVEVDADGRKYAISLYQPVKKGSGGLWVLKSIKARE